MASDDLIQSETTNEGRTIPNQKRTMPDPAAAGRRSGEVRRHKADLRKAAQAILATKPGACGLELRNILRRYGYDPSDCSNAEMLLLRQLDKAINNGDTSAAIFIRDTSGQSPTAKTEISIDRPSAGADLRLLSDADLQKLIDNE